MSSESWQRFTKNYLSWPVILVLGISSLVLWSATQPKTEPASVLSLATVAPTASPVTDQSSTPTPLPTETVVASESAMQVATLRKVIDGDTLQVEIAGQVSTVRVIGINTPEVVDPRKAVECFGAEASRYAKLYFEQAGSTLWLAADPTQTDRDKYQRLLRYVYTDEALVDFGKVMISLGYASEYTYDNPYQNQALYKEAMRQAQTEKKGLWADGVCQNTVQNTAKPKAAATKAPQPVSPATTAPSTTGGDKDCGDFATHQAAQSYFESKGGSPSNNVDRLDNDHDGVACESLP